MAKKKKGSRSKSTARAKRRAVKRPVPRPQPWFQNLDRARAHELAQRFYSGQLQAGMVTREEFGSKVADRRAELQARARSQEWEYLATAVKQLRPLFKGFESRDGYDLHRIETWPNARRVKVRRMVEDVRSRLARPHVLARPTRYRKKAKQDAFRRALARETGEGRPAARVYIVPVQGDTGRRQTVALTPRGDLERRDYYKPGHYVTEQIWRFRDYLRPRRQPVKPSDFFKAAKSLLPHLPEFMRFRFFTTTRGMIGPFFGKDLLLDELRRYFDEYANEFVETLQGVAFYGTREQAFKRTAKEEQRRQKALVAKSLSNRIRHSRQKYYRQQHLMWLKVVRPDEYKKRKSFKKIVKKKARRPK